MSKDVKVYIVGNGCDRRLLDSAVLDSYFRENECDIVSSPEVADYIFLNTCGMSTVQEDTCFNLIEYYKKYKGELIVHGCLPQTAETRFKEKFKGRSFSSNNLEKIDMIFPENKKSITAIKQSGSLYHDISHYRKFISKFELSWNFFYLIWIALKFKIKYWSTPLHPRMRKGIYLRVSGGCSDNCTFCVIPKAVGAIKSRPINDILSEYNQFLKDGHRHFILTGDNVGSYGVGTSLNIGDLLLKMENTDQFYEVQWTFNEFHPRWLIKHHDALLPLLKKKKIREMCVPVQSGANHILTSMNRHHNVEDIKKVLIKIKNVDPSLELNTDVIIGFPGETDEDFKKTLDLIIEIGFNQVQFFSYSDREGSEASSMGEKNEQSHILKRLKMAMKVLKKYNIRYSYS